MASPVWRKNLHDGLLLSPLVVAHGNVKDLFPVDPDSVNSLPEHLQLLPYVRFDVWMALEFERLGYPIVILYDPVDGIVALRGQMVSEFQRMASQAPRAGEKPSTTTSNSTSTGSSSNPLATKPYPPPAVTGNEPSSVGEKGESPEGKPSVKASPTAPALPSANSPNPQAPRWLCALSSRQSPLEFFRTLYENVLPRVESSVAVICRYADRYLGFTNRQSEEERRLSLMIQKAAMAIPPTAAVGGLSSRVVLTFNTEGEVPQELNVQAPFSQSIFIPSPTLEEREDFIRSNHFLFHKGDATERFDPVKDSNHLRLVANLADGLKTQDLLSLITLSHREQLGLGPQQVKLLLDRLRFGTHENAWLKIKPESLRNAKTILAQRVKGQEEVINEVVPVLIRAKLGMSNPGGAANSTRVRGAFFFVGPTGVGKTELSKAIAELIFGDENAMLRFDMSEYSEEHQQARLIGAPPGYVGFDQGGQLTNAILEKPFSVVLFDEIEKAHGRILDKFLQILDDGRLTDGMGRTIYFSEAIIIFTSNIGTSPRTGGLSNTGEKSTTLTAGDWGGGGGVQEVYSRLAELTYPELSQHFRQAVRDFFVNRLGRPEILNRIGEENILVFNFLTDPETKNKIVELQIENLNRELRKKYEVEVYCTQAFKKLLVSHPNGFEKNGARGVRNLLSRFVLNPLAEQIFLAPDACHGKTFRIDYLIPLDQISSAEFDRHQLHYEWFTP